MHDREVADRRHFEAMVDEYFAGVLDYAVACADLETVAAAAAAVLLGAALAAYEQRGLMDRRHGRVLTPRSIGREPRQAGFTVVRTHFTALPLDVPTDGGKARRVVAVLGRLAIAIHPSRLAYPLLCYRDTSPTPTPIDEWLIA